jgi:hypothetical protein
MIGRAADGAAQHNCTDHLDLAQSNFTHDVSSTF